MIKISQLLQELNKNLATYDFFSDLPVSLFAYFGNLGPERLKEPVLDPKKAHKLPQYLKKKNLTIEDFEKVRAGTYQPRKNLLKPCKHVRKFANIFSYTVGIWLPETSSFQSFCPVTKW